MKDKNLHPATHTPDRHLHKSLSIRVPDAMRARITSIVSDANTNRNTLLLEAMDAYLTSKGY